MSRKCMVLILLLTNMEIAKMKRIALLLYIVKRRRSATQNSSLTPCRICPITTLKRWIIWKPGWIASPARLAA